MKIIITIFFLFLHWTPRVLSVIFAFLIGFLALLGYNNGPHPGFWKSLMALLGILIPMALIITVLVFAWRKAWIGGVSYLIFGIATIIKEGWDSTFSIQPIVILIGFLFLVNWFLRENIKKAQALYNGDTV